MATPLEVSETLLDAAPVPVKVTICGLVLALSVMVNVPLSGPVVVGAKLTLMVQFVPAARVEELAGQLLVSEKLALVTMLVIVRGTVPVLLTVTGCEALVVPTPWLPKEGRLEGETVTVGAAAVPLKVTIWVPALSVIVRVPGSADTAVVEVNVTLIVQAPPAPMPVPQVLVWAKLALGEGVMAEKVSAAVPESVTITV
jgi:hypothetical protein